MKVTPKMEFWSAFKKVMFYDYANFTGRARRSEFYWYYFALIVIFACFAMLCHIPALFFCYVNDVEKITLFSDILGWFYVVYKIITLIPSMAVSARRLHDIGYSGLASLFCLIPFLGSAIIMIICMKDSQVDENKYGISPKYFDEEEEFCYM